MNGNIYKENVQNHGIGYLVSVLEQLESNYAMKFSSSSSSSLTVNKLTTKTTPTSVTTTDSCSHVYSINSKFSNSSNPMLAKLNSG